MYIYTTVIIALCANNCNKDDATMDLEKDNGHGEPKVIALSSLFKYGRSFSFTKVDGKTTITRLSYKDGKYMPIIDSKSAVLDIEQGVVNEYRCSSCKFVCSKLLPSDTVLNQHSYFSRGECPYLRANHTPERLKIEIGIERSRRGFIAHPDAITVPDLWKQSDVKLTQKIYVTLASELRCYLCGRPPGDHARGCYKRMKDLVQKLEDGFSELKL